MNDFQVKIVTLNREATGFVYRLTVTPVDWSVSARPHDYRFDEELDEAMDSLGLSESRRAEVFESLKNGQEQSFPIGPITDEVADKFVRQG